MPCSGCGGSGHNIRTCSGSSSFNSQPKITSYEATTSRVVRTCSVCYEPGHNIRTCPGKSVINAQPIRACSGCNEPGHNIRTCPGKSVLNIQPIRACSGCNKPGHNIRTCPGISVFNAQPIRACSGCNEPGHNIRTCPKVSQSPTNAKLTSLSEEKLRILARKPEVKLTRYDINSKDTKSQHKLDEITADATYKDIDELLRILDKNIEKSGTKILVPKSDTKTHSVEAERKLVVQRPKKTDTNSYINDTDEVKGRIDKGPPEKDGPGYIYMYKIANIEPEKAGRASSKGGTEKHPGKPEDIYKIGMTKNLPERRMAASGYNNGEQYTLIFSTGVAHRKLTEKVVHDHLKTAKRQYHRDIQDGGTEWFQGDRQRIIETINYSKKIVESKHPGEEPKL